MSTADAREPPIKTKKKEVGQSLFAWVLCPISGPFFLKGPLALGPQGAPKEFVFEREEYLISGRWPLNGVGRYFFLLVLFNFFFEMAFLCVSQQGEFKTPYKASGGNPCQKLLAEKAEKKKLFSCRLFPSMFFYRVFGRFSA
jgi:hypothetical protein